MSASIITLILYKIFVQYQCETNCIGIRLVKCDWQPHGDADCGDQAEFQSLKVSGAILVKTAAAGMQGLSLTRKRKSCVCCAILKHLSNMKSRKKNHLFYSFGNFI